jgi:hypothetical protein
VRGQVAWVDLERLAADRRSQPEAARHAAILSGGPHSIGGSDPSWPMRT